MVKGEMMPHDEIEKLLRFLRTRNPNYFIEAIMHKQFKGHPEMVIADELLHILVEGKIKPRKFIRYNLKHLIKELNRR